jgi:hypothetical protein
MINSLKNIRRIALLTLLCVAFTLPPQRTNAAAIIPIVEIIKAAVKKVIVAVDLQIQRQQNKVIWLQNAQKVLENTMSKLKLDEISSWTEKQRELYTKYFDELQQVKLAISSYQRVRDITQKQTLIVTEYKKVWAVIQQDIHFTTQEKKYMAQVYSGILGATVDNLDQLALLVKSFTFQMSDGERLTLLNDTALRVDQNYQDLLAFNRSNGKLSLQRARSSTEISRIQRLYGIHP